jgi:hypothetical protein
MRRFCVLLLVVSTWVGIGVAGSPAALADGGRWKVGDAGCYWDPNDSGPDQCSPNVGRYKVGDGGQCYWDANDSGPNQCEPAQPAPAETLPDQPIPYTDDTSSVQRSFDGGAGPSGISCRSYAPPAFVGTVRVSVNVDDGGTLHYAMGMPHWWENYGLWIVRELVNGRMINEGRFSAWSQSGSEPPSVVPSGSLWAISVIHYFAYVEIFWVPAPECAFLFCYDPVPVLLPAITVSNLSCRMP